MRKTLRMPTFSSRDDLPVRAFRRTIELERWLDRESERSECLWIAIAKKNSGVPTVTYSEAVECALCFGWIDSQKRGFDETYYLLRFTPRRTNSPWTESNQAKAQQLIQQGRMRPSGLKAIERAKRSGKWKSAT